MTEENSSKLLKIQETANNITKQISKEIKTIETIMMRLNDVLQVNNCVTNVMNVQNVQIKQLFQQIYDCIKEIFGNSDEIERYIEILEASYTKNEQNYNESTDRQMDELKQLENSLKINIEAYERAREEICMEIKKNLSNINNAKEELAFVENTYKERNETINKIQQDIDELTKIDFIVEEQHSSRLKSQIQENTNTIKDHEDKKQNLIQTIDNHENDLNQNQKSIEALSGRVEELKLKTIELQAKIEQSANEFQGINESFNQKQQQEIEIKKSNELKMNDIINLIDNKIKMINEIKLETMEQDKVIEVNNAKITTLTNETETLKSQIMINEDEENKLLKQIDELKQSENIEQEIEDMIQTVSNQEAHIVANQQDYEQLKSNLALKMMEVKRSKDIYDRKIKLLQCTIDEIQLKNQTDEDNLNEYKLRIEAVNINKNRLLIKRNHYLHTLKTLESKISKYEKVKSSHTKSVKDRSFAKPIDCALRDSFVRNDEDSSSSASGGERMTYVEFVANRKQSL